MRHFVGLLLGLVIAPILLYGLGWGAATVAAAWSGNSVALSMDAVAAAGALGLVGIGLAVLTRAISPLGALVAGLAFLALSALYVFSAPSVAMLLRPVGPVAFDWAGAYDLLRRGIVGAIGVALVFSAFAPSRWRRAPKEPQEEEYISYLGAGSESAWPAGEPATVTGHVNPVSAPPGRGPGPSDDPLTNPGFGRHARG